MDLARPTMDSVMPPPRGIEPPSLSPRQTQIVRFISAFTKVADVGPSIGDLARKLLISPSTARNHAIILHQKGWLKSPNSPLSLRKRFLDRD